MVNSVSPPVRIRARQIQDTDLGAVIELLSRGFPLRSHAYWQRALARLASHPTPPDLPRYGYLLESDGDTVGVVLLIFATVPSSDGPAIRCNLSSWYVEPRFRSHAALLVAPAIRHKHVTYVNISPAMHTRPIIEAQGFCRYSKGQFVTVPSLTRARAPAAAVVSMQPPPDAPIDAVECELLQLHASYGCLSLWCTSSGRAYPFVFMPRLVKGIIPCAQLVYSRDMADFVRFARPLGRFLSRRGRPFVIIDSDGPIAGLIGRYFDEKSPKFFRGGTRPHFGDLAYTEAVMFGL